MIWLDSGVDSYREITGLPIATYFSGTKMRWMLDNCEEVKNAEAEERLCFGTIDSWLTYKLTGGEKHVTDSTNASRTMCMNLETLDWEQKMLNIFGIKRECLPQIIKESAGIFLIFIILADFGIISEGILSGVPITGIIGDQQSACLGHTLLPGEVKSTYGTGCFILMNNGTTPIHSKNGLLTTVLYKLDKNSKASYALEGAAEWGGVTIEWAKNNMGLFKDFKEFDELLNSVENSGGVIFVPALSGLFSPYWRNDIRGTIFGMSLHTHRGHILNALTNSIFMRCNEIVKAMDQDCEGEIEIQRLVVDGGVTLNSNLMQSQADILNKNVVTKKEKEITAIGAGIAAGLQVGMWKDLDQVRNWIKEENTFIPQLPEKIRIENEKKWKEAVERALGWV